MNNSQPEAGPAGKLAELRAQLRSKNGALLDDIVCRANEWVLGLDGRIAGRPECRPGTAPPNDPLHTDALPLLLP